MSTNKLLILDWGIGGLSVFKEVKRRWPAADCIYISDSGFTPYGKVPAPALAERVVKVIARGQGLGATRAIIACNAASTVVETMRSQTTIPVDGVIEAGIQLLRESGLRSVGVIGGLRTIESKIFSRALPEMEILEEVAQPLSALIEAGEVKGAAVEAELEKILRPLREVQALLLACTHYPAIAPVIQSMHPGIKLLDPAARAAQNLGGPFAGEGRDGFFTTGSAANSKKSAALAFGVDASFQEFQI